MIYQNKECLDYLIKMRNKKQKPELQMKIDFIKSFNKEARKQNNIWFAELHNKDDSRLDYRFLNISKKIRIGWWIFKETKKISLHIGFYSNHFLFVDNDYVFTYGQEESDRFHRLLPQFKPILEKIPQVLFILPKGEEKNFEKTLAGISKDVSKLVRDNLR